MLSSLVQIVKDWYKLYPTAQVFMYHKLIHIIFGLGVGWSITALGFPILAMLLVVSGAIVKEISDHYRSYDEQSQSYIYDAPLSAHILDVIVTVLGGMLGVLICVV